MSVRGVTAKRQMRICMELQQTRITKSNWKFGQKPENKNSYLSLVCLTTSMRLQHQPAPIHSYAICACPDPRGFQDFLLSATHFPRSPSEVGEHPVNCSLWINTEKSINYVIPYCTLFHRFWGKKGFYIWSRKNLMHYSKESNKILQELCRFYSSSYKYAMSQQRNVPSQLISSTRLSTKISQGKNHLYFE